MSKSSFFFRSGSRFLVCFPHPFRGIFSAFQNTKVDFDSIFNQSSLLDLALVFSWLAGEPASLGYCREAWVLSTC